MFLTSNYQVSPLKDFLKFKESAFAVTFDDGYEDNYHYAFPLLDKYSCPATFFICTGFIQKEMCITGNGDWGLYQGLNSLTADQIKEMGTNGMHFGCHTHTHFILSKVPLEKAEKEIHKSKAILEQITGHPVDMFAYPLGQPNTFNEDIISILREDNFKLACSTIWGGNIKGTNPLVLHRIRIDAEDTLEDFKSKISGYWDFVKWVQILK